MMGYVYFLESRDFPFSATVGATAPNSFPSNILEMPSKPPLPIIWLINPCALLISGSMSFMLFMRTFCCSIKSLVWFVRPFTPSFPTMFCKLSYA